MFAVKTVITRGQVFFQFSTTIHVEVGLEGGMAWC